MFWLIALVPVSSVGVYMAMWQESTAGTAVGQGVYAGAKVWILLVPAIWWFWRRGRQERALAAQSSPRPRWHRGLWMGLGSGLAISAAILGGYGLFGASLLDPATVQAAAERAGIAEPWRYLALAAYLCLVNALLEEYVWRWFVFRRCEDLLGSGSGTRLFAAVALSAAFFTAHHVLALAAQFDWRVTALGSAGVFIGGVVWSWLYLRYRTIWPGYLSHVLVDIAIFIIGWRLIFAPV